MKREIAEKVIESMKEMDRAIDRLDTAVRAIEDEPEKKRILRFIAGMIHDLHVQITLPVVKRHPDLHPDGYSRTY
jgi:hypothetical protein